MQPSFIAQSYRRDVLGTAVFAAIVCVIGFTVTRSFYLTMLIYSAIYAIAALGMLLVFGFAGQISLGQAAFFGVGAYTSAYVVTHLGLPPLVGIICSTVAAGVFGWLVSRPLLRLATYYLAMATLAFGGICFIIFANARSLTGGIDPGIVSMPPFEIGGYLFRTTRSMYWLVSLTLCCVLLLVINLVHSRVGRSLKALKASDIATAGLGVNVVRYKVATFTLAAALTGFAGALFAFFQSAFNASVFGVGLSIELLVMVVVGSVTSPWGAVFGALFVTILPTFLEHFDQYKLLIYGGIVSFVTIFMPGGLGRAIVDGVSSIVRKGQAR
jgi:branched-chain amino acid transport system permease protein